MDWLDVLRHQEDPTDRNGTSSTNCPDRVDRHDIGDPISRAATLRAREIGTDTNKRNKAASGTSPEIIQFKVAQ